MEFYHNGQVLRSWDPQHPERAKVLSRTADGLLEGWRLLAVLTGGLILLHDLSPSPPSFRSRSATFRPYESLLPCCPVPRRHSGSIGTST